MMSSVVVVGSCVYDMFSYVPRLPKPGEAVIGRKFRTMFGGKGANQAVQCSLLGAKVSMVAKLGNDNIGDETLENLKKFGVSTAHVTRTDKASSGTASIFVEESGQNAIAVILGSNMELTLQDVENASEIISSSKVIVCQLETPPETIFLAFEMAKKGGGQNAIAVILGSNTELTLQDVENASEIISNSKVVVCQLETPPETIFLAFEIAKKGGATTIWNAATGIPNLENIEKYLQLADITVTNEYETSLLSKMETKSTSDIYKAMAKIMEMGAKTLVVTLGEDGCYFCDNKSNRLPVHVKSDSKVEPVDATGAGDSFIGTLVFFLSEMPHLAFDEILKRSCFVAEKCVERAGTQTSYYSRDGLPSSLFV
uniref:Ribokinase n=1 Tax=Romanomermis culicivorax TaxID=13658 RepID=A0A915KKT1_ROMCU